MLNSNECTCYECTLAKEIKRLFAESDQETDESKKDMISDKILEKSDELINRLSNRSNKLRQYLDLIC